MDKLIITVACDSRTSYPINHYCPPQEDIAGVAQQYIDGIKAGAAIAHIHGIRTLEESLQADGKQVSRIDHDGWKRLQEAILAKTDPVMQFGVASARLEEKVKLMTLHPDMMAVAFNAHDEYFNPDPQFPPKRMMAIHPVEELLAYAKAAEQYKVKLEVECFHTGAFWHLEFVRKQGYLGKRLHHFVSRLARRHLDAADREGADLYGRSPAEKLHLERQRDEPAKAMGSAVARGLARRPCPRRLRGQSLYRAGRARQEQRGSGRAHDEDRARARPRGGDTAGSAPDPRPRLDN